MFLFHSCHPKQSQTEISQLEAVNPDILYVDEFV